MAAQTADTAGWLDNPAWGQTFLPLLIMLAIARLLSLGFLASSQHGYRARLLSRGRAKEIRTEHAGDASRRQYLLRELSRAYPPHWVSSVMEPLVGVVVVGGLTVALMVATHHTFTDPQDIADLKLFRYSPPWPTTQPLLGLFGAPGGVAAALLGAALTALWLLLWARTRFLVLCTQMPSGTWERSALRRYLPAQLGLRWLLVALAVPIAGIASMVLWQAVSLWRARALHRLPLVQAPPTTAAPDAGTLGATAGAAPTFGGMPFAAPAFGAAGGTASFSTSSFSMSTTGPASAATTAAAVAAAAAAAAATVGGGTPAAGTPAAAAAPQTPPQPATPPRPAAPPSAPPAAAAAPTPTAMPTAPGTVRDSGFTGVVPSVKCDPLPAGTPPQIGAYQLLGKLGAGGFGTVYVARRQGSATQVALKTLHADLVQDPGPLQRFRNEAAVLAQVPDAHTAKVLDSGVADGTPFIAMELLDGRPLDAHLRTQGVIRSAEALRALALALAVALDAMHRRNLVHRDLKPSNVMMTTDGPRLLDFGITMIIDQTRLTNTGVQSPGTPPYMSPEQVKERVIGPATDVWAWACCLVTAAHGNSPFAATTALACYYKILDEPADPAALAAVRALDPALADVVELALVKDLARRPADGGALLRLLSPGGSNGAGHTAEITRGWQSLGL